MNVHSYKKVTIVYLLIIYGAGIVKAAMLVSEPVERSRLRISRMTKPIDETSYDTATAREFDNSRRFYPSRH